MYWYNHCASTLKYGKANGYTKAWKRWHWLKIAELFWDNDKMLLGIITCVQFYLRHFDKQKILYWYLTFLFRGKKSYFTSSTPSIHLGESLLATPMPASGSKLIPDTRAIRSSTSWWQKTWEGVSLWSEWSLLVLEFTVHNIVS